VFVLVHVSQLDPVALELDSSVHLSARVKAADITCSPSDAA
jgi:hypothetical protein